MGRVRMKREGLLEGGRGRGKGKDEEGWVMFSSARGGEVRQSEGDGEGENEEGGFVGGWKRKGKSWAGEVWAMPGVMDTLALVYLGGVLRQEPVRIGDLF